MTGHEVADLLDAQRFQERPVPRIPDGPGEIRDRFRRAIGSP